MSIFVNIRGTRIYIINKVIISEKKHRNSRYRIISRTILRTILFPCIRVLVRENAVKATFLPLNTEYFNLYCAKHKSQKSIK